jgi:hypothetical protein
MPFDRHDEQRILNLESTVRQLQEQVKFLDQGMKDAQLYINELLKRAGIKGGFRV